MNLPHPPTSLVVIQEENGTEFRCLLTGCVWFIAGLLLVGVACWVLYALGALVLSLARMGGTQ